MELRLLLRLPEVCPPDALVKTLPDLLALLGRPFHADGDFPDKNRVNRGAGQIKALRFLFFIRLPGRAREQHAVRKRLHQSRDMIERKLLLHLFPVHWLVC